MIEFGTLGASDIEVRVSQVSEKGCSLLLYKDARCDMRVLDDTVGTENWDCSYERIGNSLFCTVGIRCELPGGEVTWVYKQDVGVPSSYEPAKGEASDAFKRACFKWGIGRELYTAPFIWIDAGQLQKHYERDGRWVCFDRFRVDSIKVEDGRITDLEIANQHNFIVYSTKRSHESASGRFEKIKRLKAEAIEAGIKEQGIEDGIASIIKGKPKKSMSDMDIKAVEGYLATLIRDMAELQGSKDE